MKARIFIFSAFGVFGLSGCANLPDGPSVMALPGTGKSFEQFRFDDAECQNYALTVIGGETANQAAAKSTAGNAAIGTAIGAVAGAVIGGRGGAGLGAGTGLVFGSLYGAGQGNGYETQRRYDHAYIQCMYARGQRVPVSGGWTSTQKPPAANAAPSTADANRIPPPPPGNPPPPPGY